MLNGSRAPGTAGSAASFWESRSKCALDRTFIKRYLESLDAYPLNDWVPYRNRPSWESPCAVKPSTLWKCSNTPNPMMTFTIRFWG